MISLSITDRLPTPFITLSSSTDSQIFPCIEVDSVFHVFYLKQTAMTKVMAGIVLVVAAAKVADV